jgi:hypothetical protein
MAVAPTPKPRFADVALRALCHGCLRQRFSDGSYGVYYAAAALETAQSLKQLITLPE